VLNDQRIEYALADRSQDRADIEGMLARYETTLDRVYLGRWAERLGLAPGGSAAPRTVPTPFILC